MPFRDTSQDYGHEISFGKRVPKDDSFEREICNHCGLIDYVNPKIIAGVVATWEDKILMCKRAIEPRKGFWTLPAGFMEQRETTAQGAAREATEEAGADIETGSRICTYHVERLRQVQMFSRGVLRNPNLAPGAA